MTWPVVGGVRLPNLDPAVRELFVNTTTGADTNIGTVGAPLATLQEAVNRFKNPLFGVQPWVVNDDRVIRVTGNVVEQISIPAHTGEGALIIRSEDIAVVQTLTQVGAATTIARTADNFFVRHRMNYVQAIAGPTADTGMFIFPPAQAGLFGSPFEDVYSYHPVVGVGANSLDVVMASPGVFSGFGHDPAATIEVRNPVSTWEPPASVAFSFFGSHCINNVGGSPLVVEGFRFRPNPNAQSGADVAIINGSAVKSGNSLGTTCVVQGCVVQDNGALRMVPWAGPAITWNGTITSGFTTSARPANGLLLMNVRRAGSQMVIDSSLGTEIYGADVDGLIISGSTTVEVCRVDVTGVVTLDTGSHLEVDEISIESGASGCINVNDNCSINFDRATTANRCYGRGGGGGPSGVIIQGPCASVTSNLTNIANMNITATQDLNIFGPTPILRTWAGGSAGNAGSGNAFESI